MTHSISPMQVHAFTCIHFSLLLSLLCIFLWLRFVNQCYVDALLLHYIPSCFLLDGSATDLWKWITDLMWLIHQHYCLRLFSMTLMNTLYTIDDILGCMFQSASYMACHGWWLLLAFPQKEAQCFTRKYYFELQMLIN